MSKSKSKQRQSNERSRAQQVAPRAPSAELPSNPTRSALTWVCALVVLVATWLVFQPALDGGWLDWDDAPLLRENESWRGFSLEHLRWMFTTFHMGPYQPLSWLSYAIDHALWDMDPRGYHRTNLALHAVSAVCLFFVARRIFRIALAPRASASLGSSMPPAWLEIGAALSALFWAIHPLRVESVAWITERRDCLAGLFFNLTLLAWLAYVRETKSPTSRRWYWCALLCFGASLLAKGLGLVLPLVMLALDVWPLRRFEERSERGTFARMRSLVIEKWPFFLLALIAAALAIVGQRVAGAVLEADYHDTSARIAQAFYGLAFYVRKTIWPSDLMVLYPMNVPLDVWQTRFVASTVGVVFLCATLFAKRRLVPAAVVAWVCYAMLVAPVLGLMQTGSQLVADRYSYQSGIPLSLLAGGALLFAADKLRIAKSNATFGSFVLVLASACLAPLALATRAQVRVWHDTDSLWTHDLAIDPLDSIARNNLVAGWMDQGKAEGDPVRRRALFERGLAECRKGLALKPDTACRLNAAKIYDLLASDDPAQRQRYLELGLEQARAGVELVERTVQRLPEIYESCGVILTELGRPAEAVPYFQKALELDASSANRSAMLGEALLQAGRASEAVVALTDACRLAPDAVVLWLDLGDAQRQVGNRDAAIAAYGKVIELKRSQVGSAAATDEEFIAAQAALAQLGQRP